MGNCFFLWVWGIKIPRQVNSWIAEFLFTLSFNKCSINLLTNQSWKKWYQLLCTGCSLSYRVTSGWTLMWASGKAFTAYAKGCHNYSDKSFGGTPLGVQCLKVSAQRGSLPSLHMWSQVGLSILHRRIACGQSHSTPHNALASQAELVWRGKWVVPGNALAQIPSLWTK